MEAKATGEDPPDSNDSDGWRRAVADGRFNAFPMTAIVCAFLDLGRGADPRVRNALSRRLSDDIYRRLKANIGRNHPNGGEDIIERVHFQIFEALARPDAADAEGMRVAYASRIMFRIKDAIAKEERERRVGDEAKKKAKRKSHPTGEQEGDAAEDVEVVSIEQHPDLGQETEAGDGEDALAARLPGSAALLEGVDLLNEQIDVTRFLKEHISDYRKRLAFQLFMEGVPFKTKKPNVQTIAKAVGIDESTARKWIEDIQAQLKTMVGDKR